MTFDYAAAANTARGLLVQFGQVVQVQRVTEPVYDPGTGEHTPGTTTAVDAVAILLPVGDDAGKQFGDNGVVRVDDRKYIIEAGVTVDELSVLTDANGDVWSVLNAVALAPAGEAVIYKGFVRK